MAKNTQNKKPPAGRYTAQLIQRHVAARLRQARTDLGITQEAAAIKAGIGPASYMRLETGATFPTLRTLAKVANGLQVKLRDLVP